MLGNELVSPIFKEDLETDPNNYRPISVLPVVSIYEYLNNQNLASDLCFLLKQLYLRQRVNGYGTLTTIS